MFKVKKLVGDTVHKVYNMMNNFFWCGRFICPNYPKEVTTHAPTTTDSGKGKSTQTTKPVTEPTKSSTGKEPETTTSTSTTTPP